MGAHPSPIVTSPARGSTSPGAGSTRAATPQARITVPSTIIFQSPSLFIKKPPKNRPAVMPMKNSEANWAARSGSMFRDSTR